MEYEEHPYPETPLWRVAVPAGAVLLTGVMCAALLAIPQGATLTVLVGVALALHLVGVIAGVVHRRREARQYDRAWLVHNFAWLWAVWAGLPELHILDDGDEPVSHVLFGLAFAAVTTGLTWFAYRPLGPRREPDRAAASPARAADHDS